MQLTVVVLPAMLQMACVAKPGDFVASSFWYGGDMRPPVFALQYPAGMSGGLVIDPRTGVIKVGPGGIKPVDCGKQWKITVTASQP
jgi:hypothetical protein